MAAASLQDKKATLLRLREMIFGRKSEKRKKADPESDKDEEKKDASGDPDNGAAKDQAGMEKNEKSEGEASGANDSLAEIDGLVSKQDSQLWQELNHPALWRLAAT